MGMTITEKILAAHAGLEKVEAGELIQAKIDIALGNDITIPLAIEEIEKTGAKEIFDRHKIVLVPDHFAPNKDIKSAENCKRMKEFAQQHQIVHYFEVGEMGIEHALLPDHGIVLPGDVVIGGDSHTCTYGGVGAFSTGVGSTDLAAAMLTGELWFKVPESMKFIYRGKLLKWVDGKDLILYTIGDIGVDGALYRAMEFTGYVVEKLSISGRFTMANMAIEAGAKNGIFQPDRVTEEYIQGRASRPYRIFRSDPDTHYVEVREYDVSKIEPQVAFPHLPSNTKPISEVGDISIDQVVIGSCTNGRLEDLRVAAEVLRGNRAAPYVRLIIIPATQEIYRQAIREGLVEIFLDAKAAISTPTCGPCLGGYMGVLAKGERAIATTNRNFVGRMGHPESEVYLSNPAVAAASAVKGRIASPEEVVRS
ncbi:MAG: 3-isopropylmalate dehydratase large subunit [Deltaproteobacteria bacterium]|nr:3-isopropylmalate dehydratase large subunit [Deltaproteobacteria bacterium]